MTRKEVIAILVAITEESERKIPHEGNRFATARLEAQSEALRLATHLLVTKESVCLHGFTEKLCPVCEEGPYCLQDEPKTSELCEHGTPDGLCLHCEPKDCPHGVSESVCYPCMDDRLQEKLRILERKYYGERLHILTDQNSVTSEHLSDLEARHKDAKASLSELSSVVAIAEQRQKHVKDRMKTSGSIFDTLSIQKKAREKG